MSAPSTLRLKPNMLKNGGAATVLVEHVPQAIIDESQTCTLELVELDEQGTHPRRVAEFKVVLKGGGGHAIRFASAERVVEPGEITKNPYLSGRSYETSVIPPNLTLALDGIEGEFSVVVSQATSAEEGSEFELGLRLTDPGGAELFPAGQPQPFAHLAYKPRPRGFNVYLWSGEGPGQAMSAADMQAICDHARVIWEKNGFSDLSWHVVDAARGKKLMDETYGANDAYCTVIAATTDQGGYGESRVGFWGRAGMGEFNIISSFVIHLRDDPPGYDKNYYTGFLVAHEVLHQYLERALYYLFGVFRSENPGHENVDPEDPVKPDGSQRFMQSLNTTGHETRVPHGQSSELRQVESMLHRQKCLLLTLFREVREGTLDEWRRRHDPHMQAFDWRSIYTPSGRKNAAGLEAGPFDLREAISKLERISHQQIMENATKARGNLRKAKELFDEGKGDYWFIDDDENKFTEARDLLWEIAEIEGFTPDPPMQAEIDALLKKIASEL